MPYGRGVCRRRSDDTHASAARRDAAATAAVVGWTLVSRFTGLLRVVAIGATLGPTFFANIVQTTNTVPSVMYNLMAGSLLVSVLVPSLVDVLDREDLEGAQRLCRALLGTITMGFGVVAAIVVLFSPVLVQLVTLGSVAPRRRPTRVAWHGCCCCSWFRRSCSTGSPRSAAAAQNARGRFALAAAAPAAENLALVATLILVARWFGTGHEVGSVSTAQLAVLGAGSTIAVMTHAALQIFGASRAGWSMRPSWDWRNPQVRSVLRRMVPMAATAMLEAGLYFALVVAAGSVAGGVIALQIGLHFYNLPLALGARAIGTVLLPRLSSDIVHARRDAFIRTYSEGLMQAWFVALPAAVAMLVLAQPLAEAVAFGALDASGGVEILTVTIASLGLAVVGGATYEITRQASYARLDVRAPAFGAAVQFVVTLAGAAIAVLAFGGRSTMLVLGLAFAAGNVVRAVVVDRAARRGFSLRG